MNRFIYRSFYPIILVTTLMCQVTTVAAPAIPVIVEIEPNNTPKEALSFTAPAILSGAMSGGDQDAYLWEISDADALKRWDMTLHGIPEALTGVSIVRVKYGQDPNVKDESKPAVILGFEHLLTFGIRDGSRPVYRENMFFPAGDYIVGLYQAGTKKGFQPPSPKLGLVQLTSPKSALDEISSTKNTQDSEPLNAYRLQIKMGLKTYVSNSKPPSTKKTAIKITAGNTYNSHTAILSGESWYSIKIDEKTSQSLWSIKGEVMFEHKLTMSLYDEKGDEIAKAKSDKYGHYTFPNLALNKGQYFVQLKDDNKEPAIRSIRIIETGVVTKGNELEPNDKWVRANIIDLNEPLTAKIDKKVEYDYFKFRIAEENQEVFNLTLDSPNIDWIKFCLLDSKGISRSCRSGKPPLVLDSLTLNSGSHGLLVNSSKVGDYSISKSKMGKIKNNTELEPNNNLIDASVFGKKGLIKGTLGKQDIDYFTLNVRQEPQLWRLQAIGSNLSVLKYHPQNGSYGASVKATSEAKRLRIDNLYLLPGTHNFSLTSRDSTKYVLRALPLGPPSLEVEREPNNSYNTAQKIELGGKRTGLLTEYKDGDYYRFHLAAKQSIQLGLTSPPDGQFYIDLYWDRGLLKQYALKKGKSLSTRLELEPGDYFLYLRANITSEAEYELTVKHDASLAKNTDFEPNDSSVNASNIPASWILKGAVGESHVARDWYRLPNLKKTQIINIYSTTKPYFKIVSQDRTIISKLTKLEEGVWQAELAKDTEAYFYISGSGKYRIEIKFASNDIAIKPEQSELPIIITILDGNKTIAAYRDEHQQLWLEAKLSNESTEDISLNIEVSTNDDKWKPSLESDSSSHKVLAGESIIVPIEINVEADAWPGSPVTFRIQTYDDVNRVNSVSTELFAKRFIPANKPKQFINILKELQGTINVASSALGAKIRNKKNERRLKYLYDGITSVDNYFMASRPIYKYTSRGESRPVIELAGNNPVEVVGFSFHPFGLQGSPAQFNASEVKVELSKDGENYQHALTTKLSAHTKEQFFVLDKPIAAHFSRLTLLNSRHSQRITLGEWKVLAQANTLAVLDETNIALPKLGGHVVWLSPKKPSHNYNTTILTSKKDATSSYYNKGDRHQWVIAFNHNRAALLQTFNWYYGKDITKQRYISTDVFTSMDSPLGPWKKLATWKLDSSEKNSLTLEKPVWARFVKFIPHANPKQKYKTSINLPEQIEIFEARDDQALSVLGEWGQDSSKGPYEFINSLSVTDKPNVLPTHTTKEQAKLLGMGKAINSQVRLGDYTNWYKVTIPKGQNTVNITLSGFPTVGATAKLFRDDKTKGIESAENQEIPFVLKKSSPQSSDYEAYIEPGNYYIQVEEPPRSVIFTWDTSGSTAQVRPIIQQAVLSYIKDVKPGLDEAHMLPFGGTFLSQNWLDQPYMLQSVLNDYDGARDSSATESALIQASEKLRDRKGQKIIVLITDAETPHDSALWSTLEEVRPKIIAIGVSAQPDEATEQDLMQDWASSSNGYYEYVTSIGAIERAFDRASSKIRQPAEYKIVATTEFKEAPNPGFLEVVSHSKKKSATTIKLPAPTIEVILDASGSMFSQMDKLRRYQVARNVLIDLVENQLPDNANFGLRVFGHKESGSCRTDLEIPIKRLNRKAAIKKIKKIAPKSYAKTPIAASLLAAAKDLKKIKGEKIILLITDGKETCDGDPAKAIATLNESGVNASVNIVGFAINNNALEARFRRWAKAGNGEYQQALDSDALLKSIKKLTARKFTVIGADGEIQGTYSTNDKPIELSVGEYNIDFGNGLVKKVVIVTEKTLILKTGS